MKAKCQTCLKEFTFWPSSSSGKFCSHECYANSRRVTLTCPICKEHFVKPRHYYKICCSKKCRLKYFSLNYSKENHFKWKGGKFKDTEGYVHVKAYNHPYRDKQNYVREHRLVMEKHLGRYLEPHEIIHHKNEIITDNRLENLELYESNAHHSRFHKKGKPRKKNSKEQFS